MFQRKNKVPLNDIGDCCVRWAQVIGHLTQKGSSRHKIQEADYSELHSQLMHACKTAMHSGSDERRAAAEELRDLAGPWLTLQSLQQAPPKITKDLLKKVEACQVALGVGGRVRRTVPTAFFIGVFLLGFVIAIGGIVGQSTGVFDAFGVRFADSLSGAASGVRMLRSHPLTWPLGAVVFGFLAVLAYLVFQAPREY